MGKPRQRNSHLKIIDRSELKSPLRHLVEGSITLALWAIWLYWILPLLTLILWLLGFKLFYQSLFSEDIFAALIEILKNGGAAILIILTLKLIWIYYNYHLVFKRKGQRRKQGRIYSDKDVAKFFDIDPELLEKAKKHNRIDVILKGKKFTINISSDSDL